MKNEVLYVGIFRLPDRNAAAIRVRGVADALIAANYTVRFIDDSYVKSVEGGRIISRLQRLGIVGKRGVEYFFTASSYFKSFSSIDWQRVAAVICYPGSAALIFRLMRYCRKHAIPFIIDSTEWFDPSHATGGRSDRSRWILNFVCGGCSSVPET